MLNQFIVLKKPMGRLLTSFHPPLRSSSLVISPSIVHIRGITIRSSGLFHPLRVALPKPINSIKTTSSSQLKDDDKEDSDPDDEDEHISTSGKLHEAEKCIYHKREDDVVVYLTCEMPGLDEEDVFKVMPEKNMLVVKGKKRRTRAFQD
ncbi:hypothetical protein AQUCO_00500254v1 [Aquilegia coerulea]|uniref:SHSP domain-containing protein n=1 Tax=Aquilegia coerulea TaxID=218851 RepID=A0A2G5ER34_AQUCA|nr:hypothetical protein AQUCO_00500254v1 [Aquilegia coerulea]